jgi:hypothetical protein
LAVTTLAFCSERCHKGIGHGCERKEEIMFDLEHKDIRHLELQRAIGTSQAPWFVLLFWLLLRYVGGYRIHGLRRFRLAVSTYIRQAGNRPLLICANHLTMIDSMLIAWSLYHPARYMVQYRLMPWNMPELKNFSQSVWLRIMCYLGKCIYVEREGSSASKRASLSKIYYLLNRGDPVLIFPEGGRSRTGRINTDTSTTGVGRLLQALPETRVLCVYFRGRTQKTYSFWPRRGEIFEASVKLLHPKTSLIGSQGARDLTQQIMHALHDLEVGQGGGSLVR